MRKLFLVLFLFSLSAIAQTLSSDLQQKIDKIATDTLASSGVPSVSIAVVKDGQIAYLHAYGNARLEPKMPAKSEMRYSVGSISKQFTAAAILSLQEQGKLSLDDKVSRFLPDLTRANEVTIRQLLSHTSGYQDFWPQDYCMPYVLRPISTDAILDRWARKPLDFDPGTKWQYSNTNFVIAGVIIEKASGMPFIQFLEEKVLAPAGIKNASDTDSKKLGPSDPAGYISYGLGPLRPAPKEGKGWMFAAGELAMPADDLARWDISIMDQTLLKPASYKELETEVLLQNGLGTGYGLGVDIDSISGHRVLAHGGEVSGFTAENMVFPDDRIAIVALTNEDAVSASSTIAHEIAPLLLNSADAATPEKLEQARKIFAGLQHGNIDRSLFTDDANFYFSDEALKDFAKGLGPLGTPQEFTQTNQRLRGGMTERIYRVKFAQKTLRAWTYELPDGTLEQYQVTTVD